MNLAELSKEQQIMVVMRKVLTSIARETVPKPGIVHALSESTIQDMRMCLQLVSAREQELAKQQGIENTARPHYADEQQSTQVLNLKS
jgi:hypothetical protein